MADASPRRARVLLLCAATLLFQPAVRAADLPAGEPAAGISQRLAHWRAEHYRDVRYDLRFDLATSRDAVRGEVEIAVTLPEATDLVLDWRPANAAEGRGALQRGRAGRAGNARGGDRGDRR